MYTFEKFILEKKEDKVTWDDLTFNYDFHKKKIRDIDFYLNKIDKYKDYYFRHSLPKPIASDFIKQLFHWSCAFDFPELSLKLKEFLSEYDLQKLDRSISYLGIEYFKEFMSDGFLNHINKSKNFLVYILYYGKDKLEKLKFLDSKGINPTQETLRSCFFIDKNQEEILDVIKFLIYEKGLDPAKKKKEYYSSGYVIRDCLDYTIHFNNDGKLYLDFLLNEYGMKGNYDHVLNTLKESHHKKREKKANIILNSKNFDEKEVSPHNVIVKIISDKDINLDMAKKIIIKDIDQFYKNISAYQVLSGDELSNRFLEISYFIISNYEGEESQYSINVVTGVYSGNYRNCILFWLDKIEKDNKLAIKLKRSSTLLKVYEFQKTLLELSYDNFKYIRKVHPMIEKEFPEVIQGNKFNL